MTDRLTTSGALCEHGHTDAMSLCAQCEAQSMTGVSDRQPTTAREWAELIASQFETDAVDAIEEGFARGHATATPPATGVSDALVERVALALCAREADVRMLDSDGAAALWRQNRSRHLKEAHAAIAAIPPEGRVEELVRAAYREGWLVNAIPPDEHEAGADYVNGCEETDWFASNARAALQGDTQAGNEALLKAMWKDSEGELAVVLPRKLFEHLVAGYFAKVGAPPPNAEIDLIRVPPLEFDEDA